MADLEPPAGVDEPHGVRLPARLGLAELARELGGALDAAASTRWVARIVSPEHATDESDLVVVTATSRVEQASRGPGMLLCRRELASRCPVGRRWVHDAVPWVLARLLTPIAGLEEPLGIAPSALVEAGAAVDASAVVRPRAVILSGAQLGAHTVVGEGAVIYGRTRIGARVVIGANAVIGRPGFGWATGPGGEVLRVPQLGGVVIEDDVEIGPLCTVDAGTLSPTRLCRGVKLDAQVHVAHNVELGEGTWVAAQSGFAGSTRLGARVLVGGQVGVTDHATIGDGARLAAKSGVIGDVAPGAVVAGYPAVPRIAWLRAWARLLGGKKRSTR